MRITKVPKEFLLSPFFDKDDVLMVDEQLEFNEGIKINSFIFDIYNVLHIDALKPWQQKHKYIPSLINNWEVNEPVIAQLFEVRDRQKALEPMKHSIMTFLTFLFWLNDRPVPGLKGISKEHMEQLKIKPVNARERVDYLLSLPNHYHSFIQLQQLFIELNKKYAVAKLK